MSASRQPRPAQVALLTQGVSLPRPALADLHLLTIAQTVARVWRELTSTVPDLVQQDEAEITHMIEAQLNAARKSDPRWRTLVSGVICGREMLNVDGSSLEKRPDLSILLTRGDANFPLIVECKVIDRDTDKRSRLYCHKGVQRFVDGIYAWYAREAMMLAYVRDRSRIADSLTPYLAQATRKTRDPHRTETLPEPDTRVPGDFARSSHGRSFSYSFQNGDLPGPIALWHLWLQGTSTTSALEAVSPNPETPDQGSLS